MFMLASSMVSIHISNWVGPIAYITIESTLYIFTTIHPIVKGG